MVKDLRKRHEDRVTELKDLTDETHYMRSLNVYEAFYYNSETSSDQSRHIVKSLNVICILLKLFYFYHSRMLINDKVK